MPLESRETSVLWPDERMRRRGLIKQMTKKSRIGSREASHVRFYAQRCGTNKAIRTNVVPGGLGGRGGGGGGRLEPI